MAQEDNTEMLIGPETPNQTKARESHEFQQLVDSSEIAASPEYKSAIEAARTTTDIILSDLRREGVVISAAKENELKNKAESAVKEKFMPEPKYPHVDTEWESPDMTVTFIDDLSAKDIPVKEVIVVTPEKIDNSDTRIEEALNPESSDSEQLQSYATRMKENVNSNVENWRKRLFDENNWKSMNPNENKTAKFDDMGTADKLKYIARGNYHPAGWMDTDGGRIEILQASLIGANSRNERLSAREYALFQDRTLTKLGVMKPGENEAALRAIVRAPGYNGTRGVYDKDNDTLKTTLPDGLSSTIDFNDDWFRLYLSADSLAKVVDTKQKSSNS